MEGKQCIYGTDDNPCRKRSISAWLANRLTGHRYKFKKVLACYVHFKEEMREDDGDRR